MEDSDSKNLILFNKLFQLYPVISFKKRIKTKAMDLSSWVCGLRFGNEFWNPWVASDFLSIHFSLNSLWTMICWVGEFPVMVWSEAWLLNVTRTLIISLLLTGLIRSLDLVSLSLPSFLSPPSSQIPSLLGSLPSSQILSLLGSLPNSQILSSGLSLQLLDSPAWSTAKIFSGLLVSILQNFLRTS